MKDGFKFYFPAEIEKASKEEAGKEVVMKFKGIASSSDQDSQNESLDPRTFDLRKTLWVNWNHAGSKDPSTIIGESTKTVLTAKNELYVEGYLYPDVEKAKAAYILMKALQSSPSGNKLGISVEGKVVQRGSDDEKNPLYNKIIKARITGMALCPVPVNGKTWADIMKGDVDSEEEEYDDETKKAMTAAEGVDTTSKESVETAGNKKPSKSLESTSKTVLKKSEIFEHIYDKIPGITLDIAKSVYSLIEKTANVMSTTKEKEEGAVAITSETITKAFEILERTSAEINKGTTATAISDKEKEDKVKEDADVEKAKTSCTVMKGEGLDNDIIKSALSKKGFSDVVIAKAMEVEVTALGVGISKSEIENIIKGAVDSALVTFDKKFDAVKVVLKNDMDKIATLEKSLEAVTVEKDLLKKSVDEIGKISVGAKSQMISKSYSDRFGEGDKKAAAENMKYNLKNPVDLNNLKAKITELSGLNKSKDYDKQLVRIAQDIELSKNIVKSEDIKRLQALGFELVVE